MLGKNVSVRARLGINRRGGGRIPCAGVKVSISSGGRTCGGDVADISGGGMAIVLQSQGGVGVPSIGEEFTATLTLPDGRTAVLECSATGRQRVGMLGGTFRLGASFGRDARKAVLMLFPEAG